MTTPIEVVLGAVCARVRGVSVERLKVKYPGDDDNLWYIRKSPDGQDVQIESRPDGQPPFLLEGNGAGQRLEIATASEAIRIIQEWLGDTN